jgi:DNA-binding beta-propeller fold protein YncE
MSSPLASRTTLLAASMVIFALPARADEILVAAWDTNTIERFDSETRQYLGTFASGDELQRPHGLAFGPDGNLYVSNVWTNSILRFDGQTGAYIDVFAGNVGDDFRVPGEIVFRPDGYMYVLAEYAGTVVRFDAETGAFVDVFINEDDHGLDFSGAASMAIAPNGDIYLGFRYSQNVARFDGETGDLISEFDWFIDFPSTMTFGPDGNLYVGDYWGDQVLIFTPEGDYQGEFLAFGLNGPAAMEFGQGDGKFYAISVHSNFIDIYNAETGEWENFMYGSNSSEFIGMVIRPDTQPATLADMQVSYGRLISGSLADLMASDDDRIRVRSRRAFAAENLNVVDVRIGAISPDQSPASINLLVEGRLNEPGGTARLRLRNWATNQFRQVHQYPIGTTEIVASVEGINAANRVRTSDGRIELSIRQSVAATFSTDWFNSLTDWVRIEVAE